MYLILLLGLILRLTFINKPEGLWNDEYVSWMVASTPFGKGFWSEVLNQCHMPLYYFYLKPFAGCSDLVLRLTSVVPSVFAIFVMYLAGKEYSKKIGIIAASLTSILSFLIYYSQEVRFYSLLFLFSALSLLFTIRLIKNTNKINWAGFVISNFLILFTHVLGIIYVALSTVYVIYKKKIFDKKFFIVLFVVLLGVCFFGVNILRQLPSSQWWGHFSYTNILFLFSDFLSPILTNNVNAPPVFFYNLKLVIWMTVPTIIGFIGILFGVRKNAGITVVAFCTVIIMSVLAILGKIVFVTKYATEILPIFIILVACGFERLKKTGLVLFSVFIAFHIASLFTLNYVSKIPRMEGHKLVGDVLNLRKADNIIFTYYAPDRFYRYFDKRGNILFIDKNNRFNYRDNPAKIFEGIKSGETVSVVFLDSVSFFPEEYINKAGQNIPEMFLTFSHIKNMLVLALDKDFTNFNVDRIGSWTIITAQRK